MSENGKGFDLPFPNLTLKHKHKPKLMRWSDLIQMTPLLRSYGWNDLADVTNVSLLWSGAGLPKFTLNPKPTPQNQKPLHSPSSQFSFPSSQKQLHHQGAEDRVGKIYSKHCITFDFKFQKNNQMLPSQSECSECPVFKQSYLSVLENADLEELDKSKTTHIYRRGQVIFFEDRMPMGVYCLQRGRVKISKHTPSGREQIIRIVNEGDLIGVWSLISGCRHTTTATTIEDSVICFISKHKFFQLSIRYPEISARLMQHLSRLLKDAESQIASLAQKPVRQRLAETLLLLDDLFCKGGNDDHGISLTREDLSNVVGTASESVIRLLAEFRDAGWVETRGRRIIIRDTAALKAVSNSI